MSAGDPAACGSSPGLCSQQLVVVGGALVVVLSVSDDRGQAFAHQSFCDVAGEGRERERENAFHISGVSNERERARAQSPPWANGLSWTERSPISTGTCLESVIHANYTGQSWRRMAAFGTLVSSQAPSKLVSAALMRPERLSGFRKATSCDTTAVTRSHQMSWSSFEPPGGWRIIRTQTFRSVAPGFRI